jgi:uncharacterized protein
MKRLLSFVALFIMFCPLLAQQLEKGLLWKISGNGIEQPSYIFGTIHATCNAALNQEIISALDATQQLYLEIDMDSPTLTQEMWRNSTMKGEAKISDMMSEYDYKRLDAFLREEVQVSMELVNTYKPILVESLLVSKMLPCEIQSLEVSLMKYTQMQQRQIYGLETVAEQLSVFDEIPYGEQAESLLNTAKDDMDNSAAELEILLGLYESGDLNKIYEYMYNESNPLYNKYMEVLLTNRNKNWMPKIESIIKEMPTFFAVGAAHLAGNEGIIMLLKQKGYLVEPVLLK